MVAEVNGMHALKHHDYFSPMDYTVSLVIPRQATDTAEVLAVFRLQLLLVND